MNKIPEKIEWDPSRTSLIEDILCGKFNQLIDYLHERSELEEFRIKYYNQALDDILNLLSDK